MCGVQGELRITPERTHPLLDCRSGPDVDPIWIDGLMTLDEQVGSEDTALVEAVQRAIASRALEHGSPMSRSEPIGNFRQLIARGTVGLVPRAAGR